MRRTLAFAAAALVLVGCGGGADEGASDLQGIAETPAAATGCLPLVQSAETIRKTMTEQLGPKATVTYEQAVSVYREQKIVIDRLLPDLPAPVVADAEDLRDHAETLREFSLDP